jgi:hypothetical protein
VIKPDKADNTPNVRTVRGVDNSRLALKRHLHDFLPLILIAAVCVWVVGWNIHV